jgi:hypothetical protein
VDRRRLNHFAVEGRGSSRARKPLAARVESRMHVNSRRANIRAAQGFFFRLAKDGEEPRKDGKLLQSVFFFVNLPKKSKIERRDSKLLELLLRALLVPPFCLLSLYFFFSIYSDLIFRFIYGGIVW